MQIALAPTGRLGNLLAKGKGAERQLATAALGFFMSGASILSISAPFGVALAGAAPPGCALSAAAGAALGYAVLQRGTLPLRYLAAVVLTLGLRWAFSFLSKQRMAVASPLLSALALGATGIAVALSGSSLTTDLALTLAEAAIAATAGYLFIRARQGCEAGNPFVGTSGVCTGVSLAVLYMGLSRLTIGGFSPARMAAVWLTLCCGSFAGAGAGATAGVAAGLAAALSGQALLLAPFAAGGLAAGVFSPMGRPGAAAAFAGASGLALLAAQGATLLPGVLLELALGIALLMLTPPGAARRVGLTMASDTAEGEMLRRAVMARLSRASGTLGDIADVTGQVSEKLELLHADSIDTLLTQTADRVCRSCRDTPRCWQSDYLVTADAFNNAFAVARASGRASQEDFPSHFKCARREKLLEAINQQATRYSGQRRACRQATGLRAVACDQFGGTALLIEGLARQVEGLTAASSVTTDAVARFLEGTGAAPASVCCCQDAVGRISIVAEILPHKATRLDLVKTTSELSELCGQELALPEQIECQKSVWMWWWPKARLCAHFGSVQRAAEDGTLCGDSCNSFSELSGRAVMLLSDGMGVGGSAAVDATMTTALLARLLRAGVEFDAALRLINAALLAGGGEERLCTVDAGILDLYTGRLDLYKAGAAPSFVLRKGRVAKLESASLPAGILGGAEARHSTLSVEEGDIILMMSDGVIQTGEDWIPSQLMALSERDAVGICEGLLETAIARRLEGHEDDMTALVAIVAKD